MTPDSRLLNHSRPTAARLPTDSGRKKLAERRRVREFTRRRKTDDEGLWRDAASGSQGLRDSVPEGSLDAESRAPLDAGGRRRHDLLAITRDVPSTDPRGRQELVQGARATTAGIAGEERRREGSDRGWTGPLDLGRTDREPPELARGHGDHDHDARGVVLGRGGGADRRGEQVAVAAVAIAGRGRRVRRRGRRARGGRGLWVELAGRGTPAPA